MNRDLPPGQQRARDAVRGLAPEEPDAEFLARLKADFVEGRLEQRERFRRSTSARWAWIAVPAAAAALVALALLRGGPGSPTGWAVLGTSGSGALDWGGRARDLATLAADAELAPSATVRVEAGWVEVGRPRVLAVRLNAGTDADLEAPREEALRSEWELRGGEIQVLTGAEFSGRRLSIRTPQGRVEVVGTAFAVLSDGDVTCVCVTEGTARVGASAADLEDVRPGWRKVLFSDGREPQVLELVPEHRADLDEFVGRVRRVVDPERNRPQGGARAGE